MINGPLDKLLAQHPSKPESLPSDGLDEVKELLFGEEKKQLTELQRRLEDPELRAQDLSRVLAPAVALCGQNDQLAKALIPAVERAVKESIQKNPSVFLSALLPFLIPSVRKVITKSTATLLFLNVGLLLTACYLISRSWPGQQAGMVQSPASTNIVTNYVKVPVTVPGPVVTNDFRWRQLESEDYKTYITRLRAIGCPEQTIRDLVIADLDNLLSPRVRAVAGRTNDLRYWQSDERDLWSQERRALIREKKQDIDFEKRDIVWQLMGIDLVAERLRSQGEDDQHGERLKFLPEEKRTQVRKVMDRFNQKELIIREREAEQGGLMSESARLDLQGVFKERDQEISKVLSPSEYQQYQLWYSSAAYKVRDSLFGMDATEQEFLAIFNLTKQFEEAWPENEVSSRDSALEQKLAGARKEFEQNIKAQLGEERFAQYRRGQDPEFRAISLAAARFDLSEETPNLVYELKNIVQAERHRLRTSPFANEEQRQTALREMAAETEKAVKDLMGEKAYAYYARRGQGNWIRN